MNPVAPCGRLLGRAGKASLDEVGNRSAGASSRVSMLVAPPFRISLPEAGHLEALDFALIDFTLCDGKEIVEKKMPT